ncbi:zinc finger MYM-type protein 1-like [Oratosquilla oratoria]|uniref:zinc finger MYM-type protein 1-like n=1 Tax=Oratosquilla oratoria TaxID=337810 RepID=UPI003F76354B
MLCFVFAVNYFPPNPTFLCIKKGSNDWQNTTAILSVHERITEHIDNYQTWRELELRLKQGKTIDHIEQQSLKQEEKYWQKFLERLIALSRVLAVQNLAFRGTNESLYSPNNGNFLKLVEFLALFDPVMNEHLRRIKNKETMVHYLGKRIQNELIQLLASAIKEKILAEVKLAKYFSIILDCTPDISHIEQLTMILRYVDIKKEPEVSQHQVSIKEFFLGFVPLKETTGAFMTETLVDELQNVGLQIDNLRGQGYDNGSNMKGKHNGVQQRVLDMNPRAFFVPCSAHSLNLVVNDAVKCCLQATIFFGIVQHLYNFFSISTHRWQVLVSIMKDLTIKPLRSSRSSTRVEAKELADAVSKYELVVSLVTWYNILFEVNITSKHLQDKDADLNSATKQLEATKSYLLSCRCDDGFQKVLVDATEVAQDLEIEPQFENKTITKTAKEASI